VNKNIGTKTEYSAELIVAAVEILSLERNATPRYFPILGELGL
jgi:hypothetical protein